MKVCQSNRKKGCRYDDPSSIPVDTMANHSADSPWASAVTGAGICPIAAGDFKWAYAVTL
ncbi:MAG: hypothetical protein HFG71_10620 [Hungatella sp.]|nr:hypothetical protein [Hungatella sp.]